MTSPLLSIQDLSVHIRGDAGVARILDGITLSVPPGVTMGVVGESGCGKSTLLRAVLGILPRNASLPHGKLEFKGEDLIQVNWAAARGRIGFVPQDPYLSLNPVFRAGDQILEIMRKHAPGTRKDHAKRLIDLFRAVQLPDPVGALAKYPHQFSGGQRQRLLIAAALACAPDLLVADEPTTALDVTTQREILALLRNLVSDKGLSLLFVTHDFGVLAALCDRVTVLYAGRVVESG
ncbi:MAG: ABC transporter ATP-binding protein, partial [Alphaproteobacteria bacterium]